MKILAIIPARGGSKSIPFKNIQKLGKFPLITYTIESAKKSKKVNRIIVSTDDKKIAKIAEKCGVEVPFLRPKKISLDKSSTLEVVQHTLQFLQKTENYTPDIITILLPTSPFRPLNLIDESIKKLRNSNATSVVSVFKNKEHPYKAFFLENKLLNPFKSNFKNYYQRQKLSNSYHTTGAAYTFWFKTLKKFGHYYGPRMEPLIFQNNEINIDIDDMFDFFIAEMTLKYWKNYSKKMKKKGVN